MRPRCAYLEPHKRLALAAAFVLVQSAGALDDLAEMFIKRMLAIQQKAKEALERYRAEHQARTDALVGTLRDLVVAYGKEGTTDERMAAMDTVIGDKAAEVLQSSEPGNWAGSDDPSNGSQHRKPPAGSRHAHICSAL